MWKLAREFTFGIQIQGHTAQTFLERAVNVNQSYPLSRDQLATTSDPVNDRVIANVIGLAVVAAVKYAKGTEIVSLQLWNELILALSGQVCTQAINFYLQDKYSNELNEIIKLSHKSDAKSKKLLMGYIRESFRAS